MPGSAYKQRPARRGSKPHTPRKDRSPASPKQPLHQEDEQLPASPRRGSAPRSPMWQPVRADLSMATSQSGPVSGNNSRSMDVQDETAPDGMLTPKMVTVVGRPAAPLIPEASSHTDVLESARQRAAMLAASYHGRRLF